MMKKILALTLAILLILPGFIAGGQLNSLNPVVEFKTDDRIISIEYLMGEMDFDKVTLLKDETVWEGETQEIHYYKLPESDDYDFAYEYELILKEIPLSNVFSFKVLGAGLDFFYQPALNKGDYPKSFFVNDTHAINRSVVVDHRPENIVGSIAVYDSLTGRKLFHIYRPLIMDAEGNEVYGALSYNRGVLKVEVDANYLKDSTYPVSIDPTFGKTDKGGSNTFNENNINTARFNLTQNANITSIVIFLNKGVGTTNITCNIYSDSGALVPNSPLGETDELINWMGDRWVQFNYSTPLQLPFGTYHLSWWASANARFYYDVGATEQWRRDAEVYGGAFSDPFITSAQASRAISIYANYYTLKDEGYGEDQTALGQFVDSFVNSDHISTNVNVIRNSTLEVMELNFSSLGTPIRENYTEYTEVDANDRFAITDNVIVVSSLSNYDNHHYVYFDYGAGYFTDFTHDLEARARDDSGIAGNDRMWVWVLANATDEINDLITANEEFVGVMFYEFDVSDPNSPEISLREYENTVLFLDKYEPASLNVWYYLRIIKSGTDIKVGIYSTAGLRNAGDATDGDYDNLVLTLQNDYNFRYIYAVAGLATGTPTTRIISGDIHNLTIGVSSGGYATEGYFTTVDYLSDPLANGSALVAMVNTSIPALTDIQLQFSNNNATWGDSEGIPGDSHDLQGGFESIDLRDLNYSTGFYSRFNLSTSDPSSTPRVYQSRLITTIGQGGGPGTPGAGVNETGEWIYYNLTAIANITGVHDEGLLNSTYFIDGDTWNCSEVVGSPGYIVKFNVTGIDTDAISLWLVNYVYYDGVNSHHIHVEAWNFTALGWVEIGLIDDDVGFEWHNYTVYEMRVPNDFVNATGAFIGRFNHLTAGNINDDIVFDRINLLAFVPSGVAVADSSRWGLLWFLLILICVPIALILLKGSRR